MHHLTRQPATRYHSRDKTALSLAVLGNEDNAMIERVSRSREIHEGRRSRGGEPDRPSGRPARPREHRPGGEDSKAGLEKAPH